MKMAIWSIRLISARCTRLCWTAGSAPPQKMCWAAHSAHKISCHN